MEKSQDQQMEILENENKKLKNDVGTLQDQLSTTRSVHQSPFILERKKQDFLDKKFFSC